MSQDLRSLALLALLVACTGGKDDDDDGPDSGDPDSGAPDSGDPTDEDLDGDGFTTGDDCDDGDSAVYPGATERCDGVDNDCDDEIDEDDAEDARAWYPDADGDGYGDATAERRACEAPDGFIEDGSDCDDDDDGVHPDAEERCLRGGRDADCDPSTNAPGFVSRIVGGEETDVSDWVRSEALHTITEDTELLFCEGTYDVRFTVEGGASFRVRSADGADVIFDGGAAGPVFAVTEGFTLLDLQGVTVQNGTSDGRTDLFGNTAGGGVWCTEGDVRLDGVVITGNESDVGAGIYANGCALVAQDTVVTGNAGRWGAGVVLDNDVTLEFTGGAIRDNTSTATATGAIDMYGSRFDATGVLFEGNTPNDLHVTETSFFYTFEGETTVACSDAGCE